LAPSSERPQKFTYSQGKLRLTPEPGSRTERAPPGGEMCRRKARRLGAVNSRGKDVERALQRLFFSKRPRGRPRHWIESIVEPKDRREKDDKGAKRGNCASEDVGSGNKQKPPKRYSRKEKFRREKGQLKFPFPLITFGRNSLAMGRFIVLNVKGEEGGSSYVEGVFNLLRIPSKNTLKKRQKLREHFEPPSFSSWCIRVKRVYKGVSLGGAV